MVQTLSPSRRSNVKEVERFEPEGFPPFGSLGFPFMRLFEDPWSRGFSEDRFAFPALDVVEDDAGYTLAIELPGLRKEELRIQVENGVFTISGEKKFDPMWKDSNLHRAERRYGTFCRTVTLPSGIDPDAAKAEMRDGVLFVYFRKTEDARPRFLKIN